MQFSPKQRRVLRWWQRGSGDARYDAIICEGAVRSGKTMCTGLSFFLWAMSRFEGRQFALCGKTILSVRRNMITEILPMLEGMGFSVTNRVSQNKIIVSLGSRENTFFLFGGKDERAASLIQGITLAGVLLDEVVLMPRSFVEQCCARCSVEGSRLWFSCNPENPGHWFYQEWVLGAEEKNTLRLTFTMEDNPGLSQRVRERYNALFQGVFYQRFVLGQWVAAEGLVYDFFCLDMVKAVPDGGMEEWYISCDYGTVNPTSMGLWGRKKGVWYRVEEYYYSSKRSGRQKTDEEYADDLEGLAGGRGIKGVIVDPSAASFIAVLKRRGWAVRKAKNEVISGIRRTAQLLKSGDIVICEGCHDAIREFQLYRWENGIGEDRVRKEDDHSMDEIRYFVSTMVSGGGEGGFFAGSVERDLF